MASKIAAAWLFLLFSSLAPAGPLPKDDLAGNAIRIVDGTPLQLRGRATHRRFVFGIYELSLYLTDLTLTTDRIVSAEELKYARLRFLRDLSAQEIRPDFVTTFNENCLSDCESLRPQLAAFLNAIPEMPEGSVIEFFFRIDETVISMSTQVAVRLPGRKFGELLLRSWVGPHPPSERFRRELLKRP